MPVVQEDDNPDYVARRVTVVTPRGKSILKGLESYLDISSSALTALLRSGKGTPPC